MLVQCEKCRKNYSRSPSKIIRLKHHFCSRACSGASRKQTVSCLCDECGKSYERPPQKAKRGMHQYCSRACMGKSLHKGKKDITREELYDLYIVKKLSKQEIAKTINGSKEVVSRLFRTHSILSRTRKQWGENSWATGNPKRRDIPKQNIKKAIAWNRANPEESKKNALRAGIISQTKKLPSDIETKMAEYLKSEEIPYVFQFVVGNKFSCDFGFPEHKLIVECDGTYWHSSEKAKKRDKSKDAYLKKCGYTVFRFTDKQIYTELPECVKKIKDYIKERHYAP